MLKNYQNAEKRSKVLKIILATVIVPSLIKYSGRGPFRIKFLSREELIFCHARPNKKISRR